MRFDANESVFRGFELLRRRLNPLIQARIDGLASGNVWTSVLEQMDRLKGRAPGIYGREDPSAQLRMLTERLGGLGFPFDEGVVPPRYVSTLASDLRIARNNVAHGSPIDIHDAIRAHDSATKLLETLGDAEGAERAAALRAEAIVAAGVTLTRGDDVGPTEATADVESESTPTDVAHPSAHTFTDRTVGDARLPWQSWRVTVVGGKNELENFRRRAVKEKLDSLVEEIVEFEGPLHLDRLIDLVRRSYVVGKLHAKRRNAVERQIRGSGRIHVDDDGFVWPIDIDVDSWVVFRPADDPQSRRLLHEVSPVEVANAMRTVVEEHSNLSGDALDRAVIEVFGGGRKVSAVSSRLADARRLCAQKSAAART